MTRPCPYCAEAIEAAAIKCKHCGEFLDERRAPDSEEPAGTVPGKPGVRCPQCQSKDIKSRTRYLQPAAVVLVAGVVLSMPFGDPPEFLKTLLGLPIMIAGAIAILGQSSCDACGHRWR